MVNKMANEVIDETGNDEIKTLVMNAITASKALLSYIDKNPTKVGELKAEFLAKLDRNVKMKIGGMMAKILF